jgi:hypothetical protein
MPGAEMTILTLRSDYAVITISFRRIRHVVYAFTLTTLAPNALIDRLY